jgi:hypothetical protein
MRQRTSLMESIDIERLYESLFRLRQTGKRKSRSQQKENTKSGDGQNKRITRQPRRLLDIGLTRSSGNI